MAANKAWFEEWFDSPYYHLLYNNRDDNEARDFINKLLTFLKPENGSFILDLACGKGRHSKQLADKGFKVTGIDLSEQSIAAAKKFEKQNLQFYVHDMRKLFYTNYFDFAFNFFTSFGYFDCEADNIKTLKAVNKGLKKDGLLVIDFLNVKKAIQNFGAPQELDREGLIFHTEKKLDNGFIVKNIHFEDNGEVHDYQEKVQALTLEHFKTYFSKSNFSIQHIFGNYALDAFEEENSERLILIAKKDV